MRLGIDLGSLWRILKVALLLAVVVYVGREIVDRVTEVPVGNIVIDWRFLVAGAATAALASALFAPVYLAMQESLGSNVGLRAATVVALVSPIGKYLPGRFGSLLGAIWIYRAFAVGPATATGITVISAAAGFAAVAIILIPFIAMGSLEQLPSDHMRWTFLAVWVGGLVLALPRIFLILLNWVLAWRRRAVLKVSIRHRPYFKGVAWTATQSLLMGTAFWLIARAVAPVALGDWYLFTASLLVAGILGFLAFFAPAGIGVREGFLLALLHGSIPDPALALAVILLRLNQVLSEATLAMVGASVWALHASSTGTQETSLIP